MNEVLAAILCKRLAPQAWSWVEKALAATQPPVHANTVLGYYAGASRRAGKQALQLDPDETARVRAVDPELEIGLWGVDEAVRALLLLSLTHMPADDYADLVLRCYELGDRREQQSWLRALFLLPKPERFVNTATDACRTNIQPLFEAIACENPYPIRYFPELNFNQMVVKALFSRIELKRIVGLGKRHNSELARMTFDYQREREAAGRSVPEDIWLALVPGLPVENVPRVLTYLSDPSPNHRYWLAVALGTRMDAAGRDALEARRGIEPDTRVAKAIQTSLEALNQLRT